jgi:hypothetical protein
MIELAFNESTAGALKAAKSVKNENKVYAVVGFIGNEEKDQNEFEKSSIWTGIAMEGSSKDVEALTLALDIGNISDMDIGMSSRKKLLDKLFEIFPGVSDAIWKTNQHALKRLEEAKKSLEPVRMWVCVSNPAELCGMYFVCNMMVHVPTPLSMVCVPWQIENDKDIIKYFSTGEISPEKLGAFQKYEEPISELQRKANTNAWNDLVRENAPLRAVVNGNLISVPEDFYDFALRANMPEGEFKVAQLIGKTLGYIPGVTDRWLFLRIQAMLQTGELIMTAAGTDDHPYLDVVMRNHEISG